MKTRLYAGTINHHADDAEWHNVHLDISDRGIWDGQIGAFVKPEFVADLASELPMFADEIFDEVVLNHVLEHLSYDHGGLALGAVFRILKHGGILDIEVPDLDRICQAWVDGAHAPMDLQQWIYGEQLPTHEPGDSHRFGYNGKILRNRLTEFGFRVPNREETGLAVRYRAEKP